jgi:hypothetical protein
MILQRLAGDEAIRRVGHGHYQAANLSAGRLPGVYGGEDT